jgi:hypothetical protein
MPCELRPVAWQLHLHAQDSRAIANRGGMGQPTCEPGCRCADGRGRNLAHLPEPLPVRCAEPHTLCTLLTIGLQLGHHCWDLRVVVRPWYVSSAPGDWDRIVGKLTMDSGRTARVPDPTANLALRQLPIFLHRPRNLYVPSPSPFPSVPFLFPSVPIPLPHSSHP